MDSKFVVTPKEDKAVTMTIRIDRTLQEAYRARINAFEGMLYSFSAAVFTLIIGALGEVLDYRVCFSIGGLFAVTFCLCTILRSRKHVKAVYNRPTLMNNTEPEPGLSDE